MSFLKKQQRPTVPDAYTIWVTEERHEVEDDSKYAVAVELDKLPGSESFTKSGTPHEPV